MKLNKEVLNELLQMLVSLIWFCFFLFFGPLCLFVFVFFEIFDCVFLQFFSLSLFFFSIFGFDFFFRGFYGSFEILWGSFACRVSSLPRGKSFKGCWFFLQVLWVSAEPFLAKIALSLFYFPLLIFNLGLSVQLFCQQFAGLGGDFSCLSAKASRWLELGVFLASKLSAKVMTD